MPSFRFDDGTRLVTSPEDEVNTRLREQEPLLSMITSSHVREQLENLRAWLAYAMLYAVKDDYEDTLHKKGCNCPFCTEPVPLAYPVVVKYRAVKQAIEHYLTMQATVHYRDLAEVMNDTTSEQMAEIVLHSEALQAYLEEEHETWQELQMEKQIYLDTAKERNDQVLQEWREGKRVDLT